MAHSYRLPFPNQVPESFSVQIASAQLVQANPGDRIRTGGERKKDGRIRYTKSCTDLITVVTVNDHAIPYADWFTAAIML